ncbi:MAG: glutathione S-transferase family protein [Turneriella sp.]|nr:glutathione S-transferase family protein [Turneriella sp.]
MVRSGSPRVLRLHGFPISNYYNRIKMALKLKGLAFEEVRAAPSRDADYLKINPLGVIPTLEIDGRFLAETHPTLEYLDEIYPETTPLMPKDPVDRHRVRQIVNYIDIHIDKPIRLLRDFHNLNEGTSDALKKLVLKEVAQGVESLNRTVKFSPYIAGNEITLADCAAYCTVPWFAELGLRHLGVDPLAGLAGFTEYKAFLDQNPDFAEIHAAAFKSIKLLERAKKFAGK